MDNIDLDILNTGEEITSPGSVLDNIMREVAVRDLNDFYIGSYISSPKGIVQVFFSEHIPPDALLELKNTVQIDDYSVNLEETDKEGAKYVLTAQRDLDEVETPTEITVKGSVGFDVPMDGDVEITD